ncbi:choice-of-anchor L domain-containing protein [Evansella sp. AB-rgal1]|uniref:choice-of-anchor L domain-containing protein n=1 Tax=Evansella sp. AB-rgal1 TaxID=3242696 RepID=UPI00359D3780
MYKKSWKILSICFLSVILIIGQPVLANTEEEGLIVTDMNQLTKENLVESLLGEGVTVTNISLKGVDVSSGFFTGGEDIIGFDQGIILSTGSVHNVIGPNTSDTIAYETGLPGDEDLDKLIPGYRTYDATVLEFDFIPEKDSIYFQYVFASDEYNEYVNSSFNDVFGFFINGENEAKLPGTDIVVSINNVNGGEPYGSDNASNPEFYRNNDIESGAPLNTEMDGLTVVLSVEAQVNAGEVNTIKMAIADAGDRDLDSNVFIKAGSFTDRPEEPEPVEPEVPEEPENPLEFGDCITDCEPAELPVTITPICTEEEGVHAWVITNPNDQEIEVKWGSEYPGTIIDHKVIGPGETIITTPETAGDTITLEFPLLTQPEEVAEDKEAEDETNQENEESSENDGNDEDEQSESNEDSNSNENNTETNEEDTADESTNNTDTNEENNNSQTNDATTSSSDNEEETVEEEERLYELIQITASTSDIDCEPSKPEEPEAPEEEDDEEEQPAPPVKKTKQETPTDREDKPKTIDGGKLPRTSSPWYNIFAVSTVGFILSGFILMRRVKRRIY